MARGSATMGKVHKLAITSIAISRTAAPVGVGPTESAQAPVRKKPITLVDAVWETAIIGRPLALGFGTGNATKTSLALAQSCAAS